MTLNIRTYSISNYQTNFLIWSRNDKGQSGVAKFKCWVVVSCKKKTVWVYRVFWVKIETKPQKKIHTRLKQDFFFLFICLLLLLSCYYYYLDKKKKNQRENLFIFLSFFIFLFLTLFLKKQIIIIYLAGRNWVLTPLQ